MFRSASVISSALFRQSKNIPRINPGFNCASTSSAAANVIVRTLVGGNPERSTSHRLKSSLAVRDDVEDLTDTISIDADSTAPSTTTATTNTTSTFISDSNTTKITASNKDWTFDRSKSGTPSPWAVFDAWGAGADEIAHPENTLSDKEKELLSIGSVRIPLTESERTHLPDDSSILDAYDHLLRSKSSVHFGYPYNLMFDFRELTQFLKYSINNLGDPFVPSNYGVHSRQFECSVIDFFAQLWKMQPNEYWGYGTFMMVVCFC
jgi:hypothetical protein